MSGIIERDGVLYVDGVRVSELAQSVPTPFYVYSSQRIIDKFKTLQSSFAEHYHGLKDPIIAYACKANSHLAILKLLAEHGAGADVVTGGELRKALLAGIDPQKIVFSGVGKTDAEIRTALESGILQINVESRPEVEEIARIAEAMDVVAHIAFRINPNVDAGTHAKITTGKKENKFGIPNDEILELYQWAYAHDHLSPRGLSVHIGSQLTNLEPYRKAFRALAAQTREILDAGMPLDVLDIGGGIGIIYTDEISPCTDVYADIVQETLGDLDVQIVMEPGRYIVGDAGALISQVTYVKKNNSGRNYIILDAGMNDLLRPALYDTVHPICCVDNHGRAPFVADIVGPICETGDTFVKDKTLPEVERGEYLAICSSGAYGAVMASQYNTRSIPAEVIVYGKTHHVIRKARDFEAMVEDEIIPKFGQGLVTRPL